jgi:hypothetical protein
MWLYDIGIVLIIFGLLFGLRSRGRRMPTLALSVAIMVAYFILVLSMGIWAATCWDCAGYEEPSRGGVSVVYAAIGSIMTAVAVAATWVGAAIAALVRRLDSHHAL